MTKMHYVFTFWKENKTDECFELTADTLASKFIRWLCTKDNDWLEYYDAETVVRHFITGKDGINSTFKESQLPSIMHYLKPVYIQHTFPDNKGLTHGNNIKAGAVFFDENGKVTGSIEFKKDEL